MPRNAGMPHLPQLTIISWYKSCFTIGMSKHIVESIITGIGPINVALYFVYCVYYRSRRYKIIIFLLTSLFRCTFNNKRCVYPSITSGTYPEGSMGGASVDARVKQGKLVRF